MSGSMAYLVTTLGCLIGVAGVVIAVVALRRARSRPACPQCRGPCHVSGGDRMPYPRAHHYMLLVDGDPTFDKTCDGLAVPRGPEDERYQITTDRGPRVFMLFAMTK